MKFKIFSFLCFINISNEIFSYEIPQPTLELLSPKGFRISIPRDPSVTVFEFHGAINRELKGIEIGDFYGESNKSINNRFQYENQKELLKNGDILFYWIHVQHENFGYRLINQHLSIPNLEIQLPLNINKPTTIRKNCIKSKTISKNQQMCQGELIFEDNFDELNFKKWKKEIKIPLDSEDADFVSFQDHSANCYVDNGTLHIVPTLLTNDENNIRSGEINFGTKCTGIKDVNVECKRKAGFFQILPPIVSAKIQTKETFSFLYGKVEIRAKLPKGDWIFPQIYLEPLASSYGVTGFSSGLMRVAFIHGNEFLETIEGTNISGNKLFGGVILSSGAKYRNNWLKTRLFENHLSEDFHIYSMTWTDNSLTFSVDGNDYTVLPGGFAQSLRAYNISNGLQWENAEFMAPLDKEFYLALGVSAGGIADFPDNCLSGLSRKTKPWLNSDPKAELKFWKDRNNWYKTWHNNDSGMTVDYIRVWAL